MKKNERYEAFRSRAYSALRALAKESAEFADVQLLIGSSEAEASLKRQTVRRAIDSEWVERIEAALPSLDMIIRHPGVIIADEEEILPIELTRRVSEKSVKHLAQHTNLILDVQGDEVTPAKLLNVFREETLLTYENKFINTLLHRLSAFVTKRYRVLMGSAGLEQNYRFDYRTEFEHFAPGDDRRNQAKVGLTIELATPMDGNMSEGDAELNARYADILARIKRIHLALNTYLASPFAQVLGRNFVRPPVIRTNAILKNQKFKDCLLLWEFIESCEKVGYSMNGEEFREMPSEDYVSDFYSSLALQYTQFFTDWKSTRLNSSHAT